jgi:hypothetical protein
MRRRNGMTGDDVRIALAALDLEGHPKRVARLFDRDVRTIWRWLADGAPPHIAVAFDELLAGNIPLRGVKYLLRRMGRSRDDGDRYAPKSTSSSGTDSASA